MYAMIDYVGTAAVALAIPAIFFIFVYRYERKFPFCKGACAVAAVVALSGIPANWGNWLAMAGAILFFFPLIYLIAEKATRKKRGVQTNY